MKAHRKTPASLGATMMVLLLLAGSVGANAQSVSVGLIPASQMVAPGSQFNLEIWVTQAGLPFNGFDAVIGFDPAALTLVPLSPISLQEGTYMTGACGNTFHRFLQGTATDTITDILLCNGISLTGPGQIYRLRFQASSTPQVTNVQFLAGLKFYNAGLYVNPVLSSNAVIGIGMPPTGVGAPGQPRRMSLRVAPNPGIGRLLFTAECDRAGPETLSVFDTQGRLVRQFTNDRSGPSTNTIAWDGRDEAGGKLPPGLYLATLTISGRSVSSRFTLLH